MALFASVEDFYERLGDRIRRTRKQHGVTQELLADRLGLNRTTIVNIERGRQRLAVHQLVQIADALEVTPAHFLVDEEREMFVARIRARSSGDATP